MNILFVCTGNVNRSPVAEAIMKSFKIFGINIDSAGLSSLAGGFKIAKKMREILKLNNIELQEKRSKLITKELFDWSNVIFYMQPSHLKSLEKLFGKSDKFVEIIKFYLDGCGIKKIKDPAFCKGNEIHKEVFSDIMKCCINIKNSYVKI